MTYTVSPIKWELHSIVVGQLQFKGLVDQSWLNKLKRRCEWRGGMLYVLTTEVLISSGFFCQLQWSLQELAYNTKIGIEGNQRFVYVVIG
jgi:hypothetical protein